jgi:hypothetical protein
LFEFVVISSIAIVVALAGVYLAYFHSKVVQYFIYVIFGIGIGAILGIHEIVIVIFGLRIEAWLWLSIMIMLVIGLIGKRRINSSFNLIYKSNFKFYFFYLVILFLGMFRSPFFSEGVGLFMLSLFPFVALLHFNSNKFSDDDYSNLVLIALFVNLVILPFYLLLGYPVFRVDYTGTLRLTGNMGWASFSYFLLILFMFFVLKFRETKKHYYLIFFLLTIVLITATISRTALLILLTLLVISVFTLRSGKISIFLAFFLILIAISPFFYELFYNRLFYSTSSSVGISTSGRSTAIEYLYNNYVNGIFSFLFGSGAGVSRSSLEDLNYLGIRRIHSGLAESFFDTGLIGAIFLIFFLWADLSPSPIF